MRSMAPLSRLRRCPLRISCRLTAASAQSKRSASCSFAISRLNMATALPCLATLAAMFIMKEVFPIEGLEATITKSEG